MIQLEVKDLAKRFGRKIVFQDLNFTHKSGVLGIAGSNGSGKSTLVRCLTYLSKPNKGEIQWQKNNQAIDLLEFKQIVGMSAPYMNLYAEFSAIENCRFHADLRHQEINLDQLKMQAELCSINFSLSQAVGSLSSGQLQRVKLLASIASQPQILVLDEPGSNLDDVGHNAVKSIVSEARTKDVFVILASNDKQELDLCDSIIKLK